MEAKPGEHPRGDALQVLFLLVFLAVWAADSFLLRWTTFLSGQVPIYIRLTLLAVIMVTSVWLIREGHRAAHASGNSSGVISTGGFRYVRHPLYLGSILFYLGLVVATLSLASAVMFAVIFVFYDYIAGYEEDVMEERYGQEYSQYREKTGKWFPRS